MLDGNPVVALVPCYVGSSEEGERLLAPLRRFGTPIADTVAPLPYFRRGIPAGAAELLEIGAHRSPRRRGDRSERRIRSEGARAVVLMPLSGR
jgi:hypothetical protein